MRPKIKVCGIGTQADARAAVRLGVDAVGLVLAKSPRRVDPERARKICLSLPPFVNTVGVFVDEDATVVKEIAAFCGLHWVQLHGKESPEYCRRLGLRVLKAVRVRNETDIAQLDAYAECADGFVLDSYVPGKAGGTGQTFDWALARGAAGYGPIILSGGLKPENVGAAVTQVLPYGVDVSSGVESAPGIKDHEKIRRFVEQVRNTK